MTSEITVTEAMTSCYDCGDPCTKNYKVIDVRSEDGNQMRVAIHTACCERALKGGAPIYPERRMAMKGGYTQQELDAALMAADRGNWGLLEQFTQEKHALAPYRTETCVYIRANHEANQRIEYHRGLGREGWWRKAKPLFVEETER